MPIESRFRTGAGFCLSFNTISMANGPVRGKSWGRLHRRLPVDWPLKGHSEHRSAIDREAPGRQERTIWTAYQGGRTGSIGQPGRHQGGTREAGKDQLESLRGTREAPVLQVLRASLKSNCVLRGPSEEDPVLRKACRRGICATVRFRRRFCATRANERRPEQRPERRRGFCATRALRRGSCARKACRPGRALLFAWATL